MPPPRSALLPLRVLLVTVTAVLPPTAGEGADAAAGVGGGVAAEGAVGDGHRRDADPVAPLQAKMPPHATPAVLPLRVLLGGHRHRRAGTGAGAAAMPPPPTAAVLPLRVLPVTVTSAALPVAREGGDAAAARRRCCR